MPTDRAWSRWQPPPEYVEWFNQQSAELDREKRKEILRKIEDYLLTGDGHGNIIFLLEALLQRGQQQDKDGRRRLCRARHHPDRGRLDR